MVLIIDRRNMKRTILYLGISILVALPVLSGAWDILYSTGLPVGADPADHTLFVMYILHNKSLLIPYSQFPLTTDNHDSGYYPSLMHVILAGFATLISAEDEWETIVHAMQGFVFIQYISGIVGFALLIKIILDEVIRTKFNIYDNFNDRKNFIVYIVILVLAFSIFFYATSPIIKILRDGSYGQIFAMWCIFPFYLCTLVKHRWILSALLLSAILYTHNLSALMTCAVTVAYLSGLVIRRELISNLKGILIGAAFVIFISLPALFYFYLPSITSSVTGVSGEAAPLSRDQIRNEVTDLLFYTGLLSCIGLLWIDYKKFSWIVIWVGFFILLSHSSLFGERFVRELTIPLGLSIGLLSGVLLVKFFLYLSFRRNLIKKFAGYGICLIAICLIVGSFFYYQERFDTFSDPMQLDYFSNAFAEANSYLLNQSDLNTGRNDTEQRPSIAIFGMNQWIKPETFVQYIPLEVLPSEDEKYLSLNDRITNQELHDVLLQGEDAKRIAKEYNVKFIVINGFLQGRWYPQSYIDEYQSLQRLGIPDHLKLVKSLVGSEDEMIQIYRIKP